MNPEVCSEQRFSHLQIHDLCSHMSISLRPCCPHWTHSSRSPSHSSHGHVAQCPRLSTSMSTLTHRDRHLACTFRTDVRFRMANMNEHVKHTHTCTQLLCRDREDRTQKLNESRSISAGWMKTGSTALTQKLSSADSFGKTSSKWVKQ